MFMVLLPLIFLCRNIRHKYLHINALWQPTYGDRMGMGKEMGGLFVQRKLRGLQRETEVSPDPTMDRCSAIAPGRGRNWDLKLPVGCKPAWMWQGGPFIRAPNHCQRPVSGFQAGSASFGMPPGPWNPEDYLDGHINLAEMKRHWNIRQAAISGRVCDLLALVAQAGWLSSLPGT